MHIYYKLKQKTLKNSINQSIKHYFHDHHVQKFCAQGIKFDHWK